MSYGDLEMRQATGADKYVIEAYFHSRIFFGGWASVDIISARPYFLCMPVTESVCVYLHQTILGEYVLPLVWLKSKT